MRFHVSEHDEFLLSQLLDGDLPEPEAVILRTRLENEPALRRAFEELSEVNRLVQARRADQPAVDYDRFHSLLMQRLEVGSSEASPDDEFLLSRLLDGDLAHDEREVVLRRLEAEPALRECHDWLKRVDQALVQHRTPMPAVDYGRFHRKLMKQVRAEARGAGGLPRFPVWARLAAPLAAAAAIALVVWLQPGLRPEPPSPTEPRSGGSEWVDAQPAASEPLVVAINRPASSSGMLAVNVGKPSTSNPQAQTVRVTFARSVDIAETVQRIDAEQAQRPSRRAFVAANPPSFEVASLSEDLF